ncbi:MAG: pantoate--beta-alanine ligase [Muribaculaceae bacterium]|nr:pantoate--beta-alanine ligase [Muribaculaceae bacterium]
MEIIKTIAELENKLAPARKEAKSIGLVPTMGALHAGHRSLVERARKENDIVVVSVFVNPTQFNNPDDLRTYPRTEEADAAMLEACGVDYAFMPSVEEVYPEPDTRIFALGPVAEVMEGAMRPGHFNGVAQIVSKLFAMTRPARAYFGEKDFQQIAVIRKMAELEGFTDLEIVDCPIVREEDGLALSSRNVRLTPEGRKVAPNIRRVLLESLDEKASGMTPAEVKASVTKKIDAVPGLRTEYYEIVDALTMQPIASWDEATNGAVGCVTVYDGDVRLIDNIRY